MKQTILAVTTAIVLLLFPLQPTWAADNSEISINKADHVKYDTSVDLLRSGDLTNIDMRWMRLQRAKLNGYYFSDWAAKERSEVYDLLAKGKMQKAQAMVSERLATDYLDPRAHVTAAVVAEKLGLAEEKALHIKINHALIDSIKRGNNGRSAQASWEATYTGEEYFILWADRYEFKSQRLINENGHAYDVMRCLDEDTKQEVDIWFEIDSFFSKGFGLKH